MFSSIVLAAGHGTRFKSSRSKVLHEIGGLSILGHIINTVCAAGTQKTFIVTNGSKDLEQFCKTLGIQTCIQQNPTGSANAVKCIPFSEINSDFICVLYGDTPFIKANTILKAVEMIKNQNVASVVLASEVSYENCYGKLVLDNSGNLCGILECGDTNNFDEKIFSPTSLCNHGFIFRKDLLIEKLEEIQLNSIKQEFLLTDIISIFRNSGYQNQYITVPYTETIGINDRFDIIKAERIFQDNYRNKIISNGITLLDPATTYFSYDTEIESDVIIYPNVHFMPGVFIKSGAIIYSNSVLEGCVIEENAKVGPFARIRPNSFIGSNVRIGNFVEVKNSIIQGDTKINHLSYIGDAKVGASTNIGASTVTCNYDGFKKHKTVIGDNVFVGSHVSLIAPLEIAENTIIGAGSTITKGTQIDDLVIARTAQTAIKNGAVKYRAKKCVE